MPNHNYHFWTHGAGVLVANERADDLEVTRSGHSGRIRQAEGSTNWFHFAIPTGTRLDNESVDVLHAWLRYRINLDAHIDRVHVTESRTASGADAERIFDSGPVEHSGISEHDRGSQMEINIADHEVQGPVALSVHVNFHGPRGEVHFIGAGLNLLE